MNRGSSSNRAASIRALNRLLAIELRSLPQYLRDASPWARRSKTHLLEILNDIAANQELMAGRITQLLVQRRAVIDEGEFPIVYTDLNDLDIAFLLPRIIESQKRDIAEIEAIVEQLRHDPEALELAQETLGAERAHLEMLEQELARLNGG